MIARISILIFLVTLLPDLYLYRRYLCRRVSMTLWMRLLWWVPGVAMVACTAVYSMIDNFAPDNLTLFDVYLFLLGLLVVPKLLFVLVSIAGRAVKRLLHLNVNLGNYAGFVVVLGWLYVLFTGSLIGPERLRVRHVEIEFDNLPASFDGYRIVQFSDAHLGSMSQEFAERAVAQMNALNPDLIAFTGDLQNLRPQELPPHAAILSRLCAKDGIVSVLGNHDYSQYMRRLNAAQRADYEAMTRDFERSVGWTLLLNESRVVRRGADSLVVAGTENDGKPPFPAKANYQRALSGIGKGAFIVMLQHDPSAWRRHVLTETDAQLTLSGHTHGGQLSLFGLRPTRFTGSPDDGLYRDGKRCLFVSTGLGGMLPFRFGMDPEVVEITLKRARIQ